MELRALEHTLKRIFNSLNYFLSTRASVFCKLRIYFGACFAIERAFLFLNKIFFCSLNTGAFGYTTILIALFIQIKFFVNVE